MPNSPEPPARKATSIDEPIAQYVTCWCLSVVPVIGGVATCIHERWEGGRKYTSMIRHTVAISTELVGGSEGPVVADEEGAR